MYHFTNSAWRSSARRWGGAQLRLADFGFADGLDACERILRGIATFDGPGKEALALAEHGALRSRGDGLAFGVEEAAGFGL